MTKKKQASQCLKFGWRGFRVMVLNLRVVKAFMGLSATAGDIRL